LGKNNFTELKKTFSAALNIHILLAIVILILAETIGLWFLKAKINIPDGREYAALWVYQFSVLAALLSIVQVPYNASIIAHERMNIYAYVSIIDVVLKLLIVYLLSVSSYDKLITYAVLIFVVSVIVMGIYGIYCKKQYPECRFGWVKDKPLYQSMLIFSGWNIFGSFSWMTLGAGLNILLNVFFGASVNAARGIAFTVQSAVMSFVNNFRTAINPQIIKSYAVGNETNMLK
jgi:O-antigen/teichoic acid export membrane protein